MGDPYSGESALARYFNTAAFARNALYTYGNLGRNTMVGPRVSGVDFGALKHFELATPRDHAINLQFRFEAFNLLNHASFGLPNSTLGNAAFGQISSASASRKLQFGLKLLF